MPSITPHTVAELIYWSYANLAMAHDGIVRGLPTYDKTSFIIRMRLYKGLLSGKMQISSLFKDERWKMENGARCVYCGSTDTSPWITCSQESRVAQTMSRTWSAVANPVIAQRGRRT